MANPPKKKATPAPKTVANVTPTPENVANATESEGTTPAKKSDVKPVFKVDSDIPIPPRAGGRGGRSGSKYPIRELEIGQSVFIPGKATKVASAIQAAKKENPTYAFTSRVVTENFLDPSDNEEKETEGVRVWRAEDKAVQTPVTETPSDELL